MNLMVLSNRVPKRSNVLGPIIDEAVSQPSQLWIGFN